MTQFAEQVKIRFISQLIKGFPRVLQKLCKYFNGTVISAFLMPPLILAKNLDLTLNELESVRYFFAHLYNIAINFWLFLNYHYILLNYRLTLQHQDLSHHLIVFYLFQLHSQ